MALRDGEGCAEVLAFHSLDYSVMHGVVVGEGAAGAAVFALDGGGGGGRGGGEGPDGAAEAAVVGDRRGHVFVRL